MAFMLSVPSLGVDSLKKVLSDFGETGFCQSGGFFGGFFW